MLRSIHKSVGLSFALLLMVLAASGAVLSVIPAWETMEAVSSPANSVSVAKLAGQVAGTYPGVEQLKRLPSGQLVAFSFTNGSPVAQVVDPSSGKPVADYAPSAFKRWTTILHRSLFLGDGGRLAAVAGALAMLFLTLSGLQMTARRMGGWRRSLGRARGDGRQRLHVDLGRLAAIGLVLSTVTALYMTFTTFGLFPNVRAPALDFPAVTIGGPALPVDQNASLRGIDLSQLRALTFPNPETPNDLFHLTTTTGEGYIDPTTGAMLVWQDHAVARKIYAFISMLHTGRGLWWLGLLLGFSTVGAVVLAVSGGAVWWNRRQAHLPIAGNASIKNADTVILVGSEGGGTWGFARTLHGALLVKGHKVHTAAMDSIARPYPAARRMFVLTATYGDGAAPATAGMFLKRLDALAGPPAFPVAVLGFGDRQFPKFCRFALDVETALAGKGWASLMPLVTIDRQSAQEFARWGETLSAVMGEDLVLAHAPVRPRTHTLTLTERADYGEGVQAPTSVLRFALPKSGMFSRVIGRGGPRFAAGDLLAVSPPDDAAPRYYSLASSTRDGFVEICVRKQPGGVCSGFLHGLQPGDRIEAFVKANPSYRPVCGRRPVILIGAGAGIAPLVGFIRANSGRRPMHLYFGGRDPASDFLYRREIACWLKDRRLTSLITAFSRVKGGGYVQDRLLMDADRLRTLVADGAQIMVCGGRGMAAGVMEAMAKVLAPAGVTPAVLKAEGRYAEDVY